MTARLGDVGVWARGDRTSPQLVAELERLGYGALWIGGSPPADLAVPEKLLDATDEIVVATGIVNIWNSPADEVAQSYHRIAERFPGRFLLGIGVGHPEATQDRYRRPYEALVEYLDALDAAGVPQGDLALAALGPKVLQLSAQRTAGAHPYLTTPEHTRSARELLGAGPLVAPEQHVILDTDVERARALARGALANYLRMSNYRNNWARLGFPRGRPGGRRERPAGRRARRPRRRADRRGKASRAPRRRCRPRLPAVDRRARRGPAARVPGARRGGSAVVRVASGVRGCQGSDGLG